MSITEVAAPPKGAALRHTITSLDDEEFWSNVEVQPNGCWHWTGYTMRSGYGQVTRKRKSYRVHRYAYMLSKGDIPAGQVVCHTCDCPKCVNPEHLWLGTQADNLRDMRTKNRGNTGPGIPRNRGELAGNATKTDAEVIEFRRIWDSGKYATHTQMAADLGMKRMTLSKILRRLTWAHLP